MDNVCKISLPRTGAPRLVTEAVSTFYGEAQALKGISLKVHPHEVVAILGSNGAGKTTLLKTITGLLTPREGKIVYDGVAIQGIPAHRIIRHGISSVPEGRELFGPLTVMDNLLLGTYSFSAKKRKEVLAGRLEMVFSLFPILKDRLKQRADTMSGGNSRCSQSGGR